VGGVVILAAFLLLERRARRPLVPLRIRRGPMRRASHIARAVAGLAAAGFFPIVTYYFQAIVGFSAAKTGLSIPQLPAGRIPLSAPRHSTATSSPSVIFAVAGVMTLLLYPPNPARSVSAQQPDPRPAFTTAAVDGELAG
jgi:hypothetical protein